MRRLLVFGFGYTAAALARRLDGWSIAATSRDARTRERLGTQGCEPLDPADAGPLGGALARADAVIVSAPPGMGGCPGLAGLGPLWPQDRRPWVGYLSTTGVYGDRGGGWVDERSAPAPASPEAQRRVAAEAGWAALARVRDAPLAVLRLPGIYGPGRSTLDRVRAGEARRWTRPGHVFSRIHVDDIASALALALEARTEGVLNVCDDEPAPSGEVTAEACRLLHLPIPPQEPLDMDALSPMARRFWSESRRVANARAKAALGWRPAYPSYREGLAAVLAAGG